MNWATTTSGAKLVDFSSELDGCEASNVLEDNLNSIWLSEVGSPQWLCISLAGIAQCDSLIIRTVGWHCWHPYSTNPKVVTMHVSSDGSKFKLWDNFTVHEQTRGTQLYSCAPVDYSLYPFVAFEVAQTFGGSQTYMNRVFLYSDEVTASPSSSKAEEVGERGSFGPISISSGDLSASPPNDKEVPLNPNNVSDLSNVDSLDPTRYVVSTEIVGTGHRSSRQSRHHDHNLGVSHDTNALVDQLQYALGLGAGSDENAGEQGEGGGGVESEPQHEPHLRAPYEYPSRHQAVPATATVPTANASSGFNTPAGKVEAVNHSRDRITPDTAGSAGTGGSSSTLASRLASLESTVSAMSHRIHQAPQAQQQVPLRVASTGTGTALVGGGGGGGGGGYARKDVIGSSVSFAPSSSSSSSGSGLEGCADPYSTSSYSSPDDCDGDERLGGGEKGVVHSFTQRMDVLENKFSRMIDTLEHLHEHPSQDSNPVARPRPPPPPPPPPVAAPPSHIPPVADTMQSQQQQSPVQEIMQNIESMVGRVLERVSVSTSAERIRENSRTRHHTNTSSTGTGSSINRVKTARGRSRSPIPRSHEGFSSSSSLKRAAESPVREPSLSSSVEGHVEYVERNAERVLQRDRARRIIQQQKQQQSSSAADGYTSTGGRVSDSDGGDLYDGSSSSSSSSSSNACSDNNQNNTSNMDAENRDLLGSSGDARPPPPRSRMTSRTLSAKQDCLLGHGAGVLEESIFELLKNKYGLQMTETAAPTMPSRSHSRSSVPSSGSGSGSIRYTRRAQDYAINKPVHEGTSSRVGGGVSSSAPSAAATSIHTATGRVAIAPTSSADFVQRVDWAQYLQQRVNHLCDKRLQGGDGDGGVRGEGEGGGVHLVDSRTSPARWSQTAAHAIGAGGGGRINYNINSAAAGMEDRVPISVLAGGGSGGDSVLPRARENYRSEKQFREQFLIRSSDSNHVDSLGNQEAKEAPEDDTTANHSSQSSETNIPAWCANDTEIASIVQALQAKVYERTVKEAKYDILLFNETHDDGRKVDKKVINNR